MIRLTELVEGLVGRGIELDDPNPVVLVHWYDDAGELQAREIEFVLVDVDGRVVLHCPRPE